jgi:COP9 signalosome complex subunit 1
MEFDLDEYASRYNGYTLLTRLRFISQQSLYNESLSSSSALSSPSSSAISSRASQLLHEQLKSTTNTAMYIQLYAGKRPFESFQYDPHWVEETDRKANIKLERLEAELNSAKSSMIKESIRVALNDLGDFYLDRGLLVEAMKCYARTRDFSSMPKHADEYCLNLVLVSFLMDKVMNVANYIGKIDDNETSPMVKDKLRVVKGLFYLYQSNYEQASRAFLSITSSENILFQLTTILSTQDLAIYVTLCSLATFNRNNIRKLLLDNREYKSILDTVPMTRILLNEYLEGKYSSVLEKLNSFENILFNDYFFSKHVKKIIELIRNHLVITFLTPFSSVRLSDMSHVFNLSQDMIEEILSSLIASQQLKGKIDIRTNTFQRIKISSRDQILNSIRQLSGEEFPAVVQRSLFRLQLMKANIYIANPKELSGFHSMGVVDEREDLMDLQNI